MRKSLLTLLLLLAATFGLRAQFYKPGTDPGYLRWYYLDSPYYRVIFPEGADSLARSYATLMEQFRVPMGRTIDHTPQSGVWGKRMPIVLHTHHMTPNGSVAYAPIRMDFYTLPEPKGSSPVSWAIQLASHEPRHQAQLEKLESAGLFKGLRYVIGQGSAPLAWAIYLASTRGEGDAVAAETGLSLGTRARTADFLNYMQVAFDQGDWRDLTRWGKGSFKNYTPDYYKAGYMLMAGTRYLFSLHNYTEEGIEKAFKKPWLFAPYNFSSVMKKAIGKSEDDAFQDIMHAFNDVWQADAAARAPFLELNPFLPAESFPTDFASPIWIDGTLYALRSGYLHTRQLVSIRDGKVSLVRSFSSQTSSLYYDPVRQRLYWSEVLPDPRWTLSGSSAIRYMDLSTRRAKTLTHKERYFNPQSSADGNRVAVTEFVVTGETCLVVLSADDGSVLHRQQAPQGVQLTESTWVGDVLYCFGLTDQGYGLYKALPKGWEEILPPSHQTLVNLQSDNGDLCWVSDRTGVNELYRYSLEDKTLFQITNTRYGATDFWQAQDQLFCVSQTRDGKHLFTIPKAALEPKEVSFEDLHTYTIEDAITAQEKALGPGPDFSQEVPLSAPKRYHKLLHPLQFHTWLPLYVNVDGIMNDSFELSYETASPGLTGLFQNTLGTVSGQVGAAIHPDPDKEKKWRGAFHAKVILSGLYPVLEASLDVGDRQARQYNYTEVLWGQEKVIKTLNTSIRSAPQLTASLRAYVPLAYRKSGILYGFIPQLRYSFSNNVYGLDPVEFTMPVGSGAIPSLYQLSYMGQAKNVYQQRLSLSARGYVMLPTVHSAIYPRYGLGLEGGWSYRPFSPNHFRPVLYGYTYAYLPGLWRTQGLKLTGIIQHQIGKAIFGDASVSVLPRGFNSNVSSYITSNYPTQWRVTADYAIPLYFGDLSVPALGYIRNFILTPHGDFMGVNGGRDFLWSAGADLAANMGQVFFLSVSTTLGVSFSWLGGNLYEDVNQKKHYSVSLILSFDF